MRNNSLCLANTRLWRVLLKVQKVKMTRQSPLISQLSNTFITLWAHLWVYNNRQGNSTIRGRSRRYGWGGRMEAPGAEVEWVKRRRCENRGAECGGWVSPSPLGRRLCPSTENFRFLSTKGCYGTYKTYFCCDRPGVSICWRLSRLGEGDRSSRLPVDLYYLENKLTPGQHELYTRTHQEMR